MNELAIKDFLVNEVSIVVFLILWRVFAMIKNRLKDQRIEEGKRIIAAITHILETNKQLEILRKEIKASRVVLAAVHNSGSVLSPITPWYRRILQVQPFDEKYLNENPAQILDTNYFETLLKLQKEGEVLLSIDGLPDSCLLHHILTNSGSKSKYMSLIKNAEDATYFIIAIFYFDEVVTELPKTFKDALGTIQWHSMELASPMSTPVKTK